MQNSYALTAVYRVSTQLETVTFTMPSPEIRTIMERWDFGYEFITDDKGQLVTIVDKKGHDLSNPFIPKRDFRLWRYSYDLEVAEHILSSRARRAERHPNI